MQLRPYQKEIVQSVVKGFGEFDRQLIVCPTGGGKTIVFSKLAEGNGKRTLILAHRNELVSQAADKLKSATGLTASIEKAADRGSRDAPVVVASIQTLASKKRLEGWPRDHFGLVVADEAHHCLSATWQRVLDHFSPPAKVVGVTATPDRGDKKNLGAYFDRVAAEVTLPDLVGQGYLSRIMVQTIPLEIDLGSAAVKRGDFDESDLGDALEPYLGQIVNRIAKYAAGRRTLVFLPLIATSVRFVEIARAAGINAEHVDGKSTDRAEKLERFRRWDFDLLSNAMLLTEGYDDPELDCIVVLRPTKSRPLYAQMVGRGTRVAPLKDDLLLLDFLWMHEKHRLIRPANLVSEGDAEGDRMTELTLGAGGPVELGELQNKVRVEREERLREEIRRHGRRKGQLIDAVEYGLAIGRAGELADYEPSFAWEQSEPSEKQLAYLKRNGIDPRSIRSKGMASKVIGMMVERAGITLATKKQWRYMTRLGWHKPAEETTRADARNFFAELKKAS